MIIGGIDKLTLIDYPGEIAAIVFTQGCNFRCHHCYNPMLVVPNTLGKAKNEDHPQSISEGDLFEFLKSRQNKIDAVVVSGGEPTLHADLPIFIKNIKDLNFKIKLDTNGSNPIMLRKLIEEKLIDYVAMDIKAPLNNYSKITNTKINLPQIQKSIKILLNGLTPYEFRTTTLPKAHTLNDFHEMGKSIKGAKFWYIQNFINNTKLINPTFNKEQSFTEDNLHKIVKIGSLYTQICKLRN